MQSEDYVDFVEKLITIANIMKKTFYAVVSFNPVSMPKANIFERFSGKNQVFDHVKISDQAFKDHTQKLMERANVVASGLGGMGLHCFQLNTEQLIELFYQVYNPEEASKQRLDDAVKISSSVVISADEVKNPETGGAADQPATLIDNSSIVEQQHKQEAELRRQEDEKETEKELRGNDKVAEDKSSQVPPTDPAQAGPSAVIAKEDATVQSADQPAPTPTTEQPTPPTPEQPAAAATPATEPQSVNAVTSTPQSSPDVQPPSDEQA